VSLPWLNGDLIQPYLHDLIIGHRYDPLFQFHCCILDAFPVEAGETDLPRTIPPLPGKKLLGSIRIGKSKRASLLLAEKRLPQITAYLKGLLLIPNIQRCAMLRFFVNGDAGVTASPDGPDAAKVDVADAGAFLMLYLPSKHAWRQR